MRQLATTLSLVALLQSFPALAQIQAEPTVEPQPQSTEQPQTEPTAEPQSPSTEQPQTEPTAEPQSPSTEQLQTQPTTQLQLNPIEQVVAAGLMTNYPNGDFNAEGLLSRAQLASILVKTFKLDQRAAAQEDKEIEVQDVPRSHWAYDEIQAVLKTGTMKGYRGAMFFPNQKINRAEALAIFAQAYGIFQFPDSTINAILAKYPDASQIPSWARKAMATALKEGFVNTDATDSINPLEPMTRGDMAYALSKYLERQETPSPLLEEELETPYQTPL